MCIKTRAWRLSIEAHDDAETLLAKLWPAVRNPSAWINFCNPLAGKRLRLTAHQQAACDSWLRCHAPPGFLWSEVLVHVNAVYGWHEHPRNQGASLLVGLTDFSGGQLQISGAAPFEVSGCMVLFDGRRKHRTHSFAGLRITLVAFSQNEKHF